METKLLLVEGLPGSGKSTTARIIEEIFSESHIETQLFLEGDLEHPADYDGVSYFTKKEFSDLLASYKDLEPILRSAAEERETGYSIPRNKLNPGPDENTLPGKLAEKLWNHDIYELDLELHIKLITEKWRHFYSKAIDEDRIYIFQCCFIQNPVTIGMVKYGASDEMVIQYVEKLARIIEPLNPVLFYVNQNDINQSFIKAVRERQKEWSKGFMNYYNKQGLGLKLGAKGVAGTLEVLGARKKLESKIFAKLKMDYLIWTPIKQN